MKLYTEEQMKEAIELAREKYPNNIILTTKGIMHQLTPIQLPTDEEISEIAMAVYGFNEKEIKGVLEYKAFKQGAQWVINKIKGGQDE